MNHVISGRADELNEKLSVQVYAEHSYGNHFLIVGCNKFQGTNAQLYDILTAMFLAVNKKKS
jgi:hypothetical protein